MPIMTIDDRALAYDDAGSSDPALVLIHGHPFDRSMWDAQEQAAVAAGWRVIRPDLRGYGESQSTPGQVMLQLFAADLSAMLDSLGVERAVIGGLSMGGQVAMEFCRIFPERVCGLMLAATFPRADDDTTKALRRDTADRIESEGMAIYADELIAKMIAPQTFEARPAVREKVLQMMRSAPPVGAAAALRGRAERRDFTKLLRQFAWPALVVVGDQDFFTTRADADAMSEELPDARLIWMQGVGHMPNLEAPEEFNIALLQLLARVTEKKKN
jgi:pimeloyl-ACP methyl ester carboxylesterase